MKITEIFVLLTLPVTLVSTQIFKSFEIDSAKYYISDPIQKNWYQAMRFCHQHGMYLLDVETPEENDKIVTYLRNNNNTDLVRSYWLGGTRLGSDGEFYWWNSGAPIEYSRFPAGFPDNAGGREFCLQYFASRDLQWNDVDCDIPFLFICRTTKFFKLVEQIGDIKISS